MAARCLHTARNLCGFRANSLELMLDVTHDVLESSSTESYTSPEVRGGRKHRVLAWFSSHACPRCTDGTAPGARAFSRADPALAARIEPRDRDFSALPSCGIQKTMARALGGWGSGSRPRPAGDRSGGELPARPGPLRVRIRVFLFPIDLSVCVSVCPCLWICSFPCFDASLCACLCVCVCVRVSLSLCVCVIVSVRASSSCVFRLLQRASYSADRGGHLRRIVRRATVVSLLARRTGLRLERHFWNLR